MNLDLLGRVLGIAAKGIGPFVETEMRRVHGDKWHHVARASVPSSSATSNTSDLSFALAAVSSNWSSVFRARLSFADRSYVSELRDVRNRWAHQELVPDADVDRATDTIRRLLRAMQATEALLELDAATGVTKPGVARLPVTQIPSVVPAVCAADRWQRETPAARGKRPPSVAMDLQSGRAWLAINLEGKQYDRWPIATFIKRELDQSQLPLIAQNLDSAGIARVAMWRDAWQGAGTRVRILEGDIAPTPMALSLVTPESWRSCLQQGLECLDPNRRHRGRRRTHVTLATSRQRVLRDVSPHFNVSLDLVRTSASDNWQQAMADARHCLEPLFDLVVKQSKP